MRNRSRSTRRRLARRGLATFGAALLTVSASGVVPASADSLIPTTVTINVSPTTTYVGNPAQNLVSATAALTVPPGSAQPTGSFQYMDGTQRLGDPVPCRQSCLSTVAPRTLYLPTSGQHNITAVYSGDGTFAGSTSQSVPVTVLPRIATTTTLTATPQSDGSVQLTAQVTAANGLAPATGGICFVDSSLADNGCTASNLDPAGQASWTFDQPDAGYFGDLLASYGDEGVEEPQQAAYADSQSAPISMYLTHPGAPSEVAHGPLTMWGRGALVAYRVRNGNLEGSAQKAIGSAFGAWSVIDPGPQLVGQPVSMTTYTLGSSQLTYPVLATLSVYVRTAKGQVVGDGQSRPGGAFTGWVQIGSGNPGLVGDPSLIAVADPNPLPQPGDLLALYGIGGDGSVWGSSQSHPGGSFGPWVRLSDSGGFVGTPAIVGNGSDGSNSAPTDITIFARHVADRRSDIEEAEQVSPDGAFSTFSPVGAGLPGAISDPRVVRGPDGTFGVYVTSSDGHLWRSGQASIDAVFDPWQQVGSGSGFFGTPAALALANGTVIYADNVAGVQGTQASRPEGAFGTPSPMGIAGPAPAGNPVALFAANGAIVLYVLDARGNLYGTGQAARGRAFGRWVLIGH